MKKKKCSQTYGISVSKVSLLYNIRKAFKEKENMLSNLSAILGNFYSKINWVYLA